jgi:hypothetical protein
MVRPDWRGGRKRHRSAQSMAANTAPPAREDDLVLAKQFAEDRLLALRQVAGRHPEEREAYRGGCSQFDYRVVWREERGIGMMFVQAWPERD